MVDMKEKIYTCPIDFTIDLISGKWSMWILWVLQDGPLRFGEIRKKVPNITEKMLIQQLKKFENCNIISRKAYNQIPPKVEYSLTENGKSLKPIMTSIRKWGEEHLHIQHNSQKKCE
ncbi:winged helix-turn-helix transcriptional regulator [Clostridium scatologenes]|uniref:MarR family transcriptional regulator n=1 Tax=Clostridium scatologenes TaxID=1548 RepID=A0A0E3GQN5_CLOSL|nr:helix-turn-helix domain-containing protein [Clostridium scatologenes]AKA68881.1 MarR family transcriptional regulator [Clostridium scatologenes]